VGKKSGVEVAQAAYEETVPKQDTDVTAAKVGSKIDALRVSFREALGFENQMGVGQPLMVRLSEISSLRTEVCKPLLPPSW